MEEDIVDEAKEIISKKLISYASGGQGQSGTLSTLAKTLDIGSTSLYRWRDKEVLPTKSRFARLQKFIRFSDAEISLVGKAIARKSSLGGVASWKSRSSYKKEKQMEKHETPKTNIEERIRRLEKVLYGKKTEKLMGDTKSADWNVRGMRFILTGDNFKELDTGPWSAEEISDTAKLAQELRRRIVVLAQNPNPDIRVDHLKRLAKELDELWRAFSIADSISPLETADLINLERQSFLKTEDEEK